MENNLLSQTKKLWDLGLAIIWIRPKSKMPVEAGWTSGARHDWSYLEKTYRAGFNVGVRLGTPSRIGKKYLAVIDVDVKSKDKRHFDEAINAAKKVMGQSNCPMVRSGRGNGSRHYYFLSENPFKTFNPYQSSETTKFNSPSKKPSKNEIESLSAEEIEKGIRLSRAWEISLYSDGRQVVLPPSIHPDSGETYQWRNSNVKIEDFPYIKIIENEILKSTKNLVALEDFIVSPVEIEWLPISDSLRDSIISGKDVTDRSAFLLKASIGLLSAGLNTNEVLTILTDPTLFIGHIGYDHVKSKSRKKAAEWVYKYTFKKVIAERSPEIFKDVAGPLPRKLSKEETEAQSQEFKSLRSYRQDLDLTKNGSYRHSLKNLDLILSNEVNENLFVEDLFASRIEYGCDTPWGRKAREHIKDIDTILIKNWLSRDFGIEPNTNLVFEAIQLIADRKSRHPIKDYLNSLKWDGVKRIDTWIKDYCKGKAEEPYLSQISRKFLIAMCKRVFEPGCQWDYVVVLEGEQGKYKSSIARAIASNRWFCDNLPDLRDKDSMLNLQGHWLIELSELADVKRADYNQMKAYIARRVDIVRKPYGRIYSEIPRQSVFIGTINEGQYLKDPTGNRRYWPVKVSLCDTEGLTEVRDQLFAEAMEIYRAGKEILTLDGDAVHQAQTTQDHRRIEDDESEMKDALLIFMQSPEGKKFDFSKFKIRDLMTGVNAPWGGWQGRGFILNVAAHILNQLKFKKVTINGIRYWRKDD